MKVVKWAVVAALVSTMASLALVLGLRWWVERQVGAHIYENGQSEAYEAVPARPVALVLGAGLWSDGSLTPILADRVATAADLYQAGKVEKLLCSGDNRRVDYNEPAAMKRYAVQLGVPKEDVVLDYAGRRTYDSCYRARAIFGVERAVVVTQRFHAARSLYTCEALGVDTVAVTADRRVYAARRVVWETREYLALVLAWWDVNVRHPTPVLGEPEPIEVPGT
ncbi:MAG: SanA/YdcF family protein, partial [Chloroflexota bacterium]